MAIMSAALLWWARRKGWWCSGSPPLRVFVRDRAAGGAAGAHRPRGGRRPRVLLASAQRPATDRAVRTRPPAPPQHPASRARDWAPPPDRPDVVDQVIRSHEGRVGWLVPVRVGRMIASPYAFLRGAANVHAADFARTAGDRDHAGRVRRRAPRQLRVLRLPRARPRVRPQRLRRGPPGRLGVGPAPAHHERLGGGPGERDVGGRVR